MPLSDKAEANREPNYIFTSIGARYDTSNISSITARSRDDVMDKLDRVIVETEKAVGNLRRKEYVHTWAKVFQFVSSFKKDGMCLLSSLYSALAASKSIKRTNTHNDMVRIGEEVITDMREIKRRIKNNNGPDLPDDHIVIDNGFNGKTTDATAPTTADGRCW